LQYAVTFARAFYEGNKKIDEMVDFNNLGVNLSTLRAWIKLLASGDATKVVRDSTNKPTVLDAEGFWHYHCGPSWDDSKEQEIEWQHRWLLLFNEANGSAEIIPIEK